MKAEVLRFIQQGGDFNDVALRLWKWQVRHNVDYGRFCGDARPDRWQDIPAVPVTLFRHLSLTCFPPFLATRTFRTSGTTGPRGMHRLQDTEIYDVGAQLGARMLIGEFPKQGVSLVSPAFDSSLGHMCRLFSPTLAQCFLPDVGVLRTEAWNILRTANDPVFVPATSFALASLVHNVEIPCPLPAGSIIMVTGGFKGQHTHLNANELLQTLEHLFPECTIVGEYGMTELSSQMWSSSPRAPFQSPPWIRAVTVDPLTGKPTSGTGLLKFIDLANHQTVLAIETRDLGEVRPDGSILLLGRLPNAAPRGCSLTVEEADRLFAQPELPSPTEAKPTSMLPKGNTCLAEDVHQSLQRLKQLDPQVFSEGLSTENARRHWLKSIDAISVQGLQQVLNASSVRPSTISIVCARGVFTAALEWIALAVASGAKVHLKAPVGSADVLNAIAAHFSSDNFDVTCSTHRELPTSELIYAFGSDETIEDIRRAHPNAVLMGYGHRFSLSVSGDSIDEAEYIAQDLVAYDSRGCMAPVAHFCLGDVEQFSQHLAASLAQWQQRAPIGLIDPLLGPEIRRKVGLAFVSGRHQSGQGWRVLTLPKHYFSPVALPRIASVHPLANVQELSTFLSVWKHKISTIATSTTLPVGLAPRICRLGEMQSPPFPRNHDGVPMWPTSQS